MDCHRHCWTPATVAVAVAVATILYLPLSAALCTGQGSSDWRNICNGRLISSNGGYQDQPQVVVRHDGAWSCVFTLGAAHEGGGSQRVVSTVSTDEGQTWSPLVDVEPYTAPPGKQPRSSGWINNLLVPSTGRQFAFYTWNCNNVTTNPSTGELLANSNLLGCWVYRVSDDGGLSWSATRYNISGAYRRTAIDLSNAWGGTVLEGWSVGKPLIANDGNTVYMQFSKVSTAAGSSQAFFFRSTTALRALDPADLTFELVPDGDVGISAIAGPHAEEGNLVQLSGPNGGFYAVFRTVNHYIGVATSPDGIKWTGEQYAYYDVADYGAAMYLSKLKNPTGPITPRRFRNGMYLMTFFANEQVYPDLYGFERRNPYWLVAGWEDKELARVVWSQPEVMLYEVKPCEESRCGIGYPDFIETASGDIFLTETDKKNSRVHHLPQSMLQMMWHQRNRTQIAQNGLHIDVGANGSVPTSIKAPHFGNLTLGNGFALEFAFDFKTLPRTILKSIPIVDCKAESGQGLSVSFSNDPFGSVLELNLSDGIHSQNWTTDKEARLWLPETHHAVFVVDGFAGVITTFVNGVFGDGGTTRSQGWAHLGSEPGTISGPSFHPGIVDGASNCTLRQGLKRLRIYNRYLLTSEAIGNWRHWKSTSA